MDLLDDGQYNRPMILNLGSMDLQGIHGRNFKGPKANKWIGLHLKKIIASSGFISDEGSTAVLNARMGVHDHKMVKNHWCRQIEQKLRICGLE